MSKIGKFLVLTGLCTACPEIEPVPISGNESAEIARSAINTSAFLKESRTCEQLSDALREQALLIINSSELDITLDNETLKINEENIAINLIQGEVVNNMKDITIVFDKIDPEKSVPDGAFLGTIILECNED